MNATAPTQGGLLEAVVPAERRGIERDGVRLLITNRKTGANVHARFRDLPDFLLEGDLLVANDSATLPAALVAKRTTGESVSLHVATMIDRHLWMAEPRAEVLLGEELKLPGGGSVVMIAPARPELPRVWYAWFDLPQPMYAFLAKHGEPIRYGYVSEHFPLADYQTLFAREPGSSEMPSAARPFTPRVVEALRQRGVELVTLTLHCGVSSFETPEQPPMERFAVSHLTADAVNRARNEGRRVVAVGTTALRALESAVHDGNVVASSGWTDLVIDEFHQFRTADGILTGFHDVAATHQRILRAFIDRDALAAAYREAANNGYSQHEFGDVHLLL
jgi:S-adenosylmethionine:tRNA ribosyltransferase-isomerase